MIRRRVKRGLTTATAAATLAAALWTTAPAIADDHRLAVGEQMPAVTLVGQDGEARTLDQIRGDQAAVIIIFRGMW